MKRILFCMCTYNIHRVWKSKFCSVQNFFFPLLGRIHFGWSLFGICTKTTYRIWLIFFSLFSASSYSNDIRAVDFGVYYLYMLATFTLSKTFCSNFYQHNIHSIRSQWICEWCYIGKLRFWEAENFRESHTKLYCVCVRAWCPLCI